MHVCTNRDLKSCIRLNMIFLNFHSPEGHTLIASRQKFFGEQSFKISEVKPLEWAIRSSRKIKIRDYRPLKY